MWMPDTNVKNLENTEQNETRKKHSFFWWEINAKTKDLLDFRYNTQEEIDKLNDEMTTTSDLDDIIQQQKDSELNENINDKNKESFEEENEENLELSEDSVEWPIEWEVVETSDNEEKIGEINNNDEVIEEENDDSENIIEESNKTENLGDIQEIDEFKEDENNIEEWDSESSAKFFDPFELGLDEDEENSEENDEVFDPFGLNEDEENIEPEEEKEDEVEDVEDVEDAKDEVDSEESKEKDEEQIDTDQNESDNNDDINYEEEQIDENEEIEDNEKTDNDEEVEDIEDNKETGDNEESDDNEKNEDDENIENNEDVENDEKTGDNEEIDEIKYDEEMDEDDEIIKENEPLNNEGIIVEDEEEIEDDDLNETNKKKEIIGKNSDEEEGKTDDEIEKDSGEENEEKDDWDEIIINTPIQVNPNKKDKKEEKLKDKKMKKNSETWGMVTEEEIKLEQWQDLPDIEDDEEYQPSDEEIFEQEPEFFADDELSQQFMHLVENTRGIFKLEHRDWEQDHYFKILWWKTNNSTLEYLFYLIEEDDEPIDLYIKKVETNQESWEENEHLVQFSYNNKELSIFVDEVILYEMINKAESDSSEYNDTKAILEKFTFLTDNYYRELKTKYDEERKERQKKRQLQQIFKGF